MLEGLTKLFPASAGSLVNAGVLSFVGPAAFAALGPARAVGFYLGGAVVADLARLSYQSWAGTE